MNPAPGLTFGAGSSAAPRACSPDRPHRPAPLVHPLPARPRSGPPTHLRQPKRTWVGDTCDTSVAGASWPFLCRFSGKDSSLTVQRGEVPLFSQSASASFPHRRGAGCSATHSPCCKGYGLPRRDQRTTRLTRSPRTNSPPPPPAPHKHLPPPPSARSLRLTPDNGT